MEHFRKNHEINIDNIRHTIVRDNDIRFAEFELGGEEKDTPLPARKSEETGRDQRNGGIVTPQGIRTGTELSMDDLNFWDKKTPDESSVPVPASPSAEASAISSSSSVSSYDGVRYYSREQQFVIRARELAWHVEQESPFIPFKSYWPTYDNMSSAQWKWYFYWREEVRSGRYPDSDLSYLFLYMYELINGIGWSNPAQGWQLLNSVWNAYRQRFPKLDTYAKEWLFDFSLVHGLNMPVTETYNRIPRSLSSELKELEWLRRFSAEPLTLNWDLLSDLMDYEPEKSRFYQEGGRKDMKMYGPKIVALVDAYLGKTKGQRLLEMYRPRERKQERYIFRSAVYDYDIYGRTAPVMTLPLSEHAPLRHYITNLIRMMENKLRELRGFKGRLRGIEMEPEIEKLVARFLKKELQPSGDDPKDKTEKPEVQIDLAKLRRIQRESDDVRDMLLMDGLDAEPGMVRKEPETGAQFAQPGAKIRIEEAPKTRTHSSAKPAKKLQEQSVPLQLDIFEVGRAVEDFAEDAVSPAPLKEEWPQEVFTQITDAGNAVNAGYADNTESHGNAMSARYARNEEDTQKAAWTGSSEVKSEVPAPEAGTDFASTADNGAGSMLQDPTGVSSCAGVIWHTDHLGSEWNELAELLTPLHLEALYALKSGPDFAALQAVAERAGSMPALLIDEINEASMETIGDLLIDGETIVDEYIAMLDQLTR